MSGLPDGWATASIEAVTEQIQYGYTATSSTEADGPRYLRITDIQDGAVDWSAVPRTNAVEGLEKYELRIGDLVFARTGATVGKSFLITDDPGGAIFASYLIRLSLLPKGLLPTTAAAFFRSPDYWQQILDGATGTGQPNFNGSKLARLQVPVPPLAEQRRIVAKLDALTARTARARADLDRVPALAEKYRLALLRAALTGRLTEGWRAKNANVEGADQLIAKTLPPDQGRGGREATTSVIDGQAALSVNRPSRMLPANWNWVPLLRLARQETGHTPSRSVASYWNGGVPWIGIRDAGAHHGREITETLQTISDEGLANSSARLLPAGTVCLSRTASVGYVTILGREMATSQDFATWTCTPALEPAYLMYALMAEGEDIRRFGQGSTHTTIYFPEIRALNIALPPLAEQQEIVLLVRAGLSEIDRLVAEATAARRLLDRLDQAILAKAFRGELVPQDPADEPASVLLERIRAERTAGAAAKPGRGRRAKAA